MAEELNPLQRGLQYLKGMFSSQEADQQENEAAARETLEVARVQMGVDAATIQKDLETLHEAAHDTSIENEDVPYVNIVQDQFHGNEAADLSVSKKAMAEITGLSQSEFETLFNDVMDKVYKGEKVENKGVKGLFVTGDVLLTHLTDEIGWEFGLAGDAERMDALETYIRARQRLAEAELMGVPQAPVSDFESGTVILSQEDSERRLVDRKTRQAPVNLKNDWNAPPPADQGVVIEIKPDDAPRNNPFDQEVIKGAGAVITKPF